MHQIGSKHVTQGSAHQVVQYGLVCAEVALSILHDEARLSHMQRLEYHIDGATEHKLRQYGNLADLLPLCIQIGLHFELEVCIQRVEQQNVERPYSISFVE